MSDTSDAEKTEEPTARRLEHAREQGDVVKTPDLPQVFTFGAVAGVLMMMGDWMSRNLMTGLLPFLEHPDSMARSLEGGGGMVVARQAMMAGAPVLAIVLSAAALAGAAGHLVQTGLMWTPSRLALQFNKLSPLAGFKRLFGIDSLIHYGKSLLKVAIVSVIAWMIVQPHVHEMEQLSGADPMTMLPFAINLLKKLAMAVGGFMLAVAGFDWFIQRQRFMARHRMSREEMKEDYRQSEGDPHVKARQKALRIQRARQRMMSAVPRATVVVMNPTHYAVALKYDPDDGAAPQCVAKGMDAIALRIRAVAEAAGVPVIEDAPLARSLFAAVEIEDFIPVAHYEAVAKIIGFIMSKQKKKLPGAVE
jgi:flagellar biosynthetic protein FlhB